MLLQIKNKYKKYSNENKQTVSMSNEWRDQPTLGYTECTKANRSILHNTGFNIILKQ